MTTDAAALTRRQAVLAASAAGLAGAAGIAVASSDDKTKSTSSNRLPVVYLPHGGGPWPFVDLGMGDKRELGALRAYLENLHALPKQPIKAVLVISAHWEEDAPTVMTSTNPPLLFDYYGFPPESYKLTWPAPGEPVLAARVRTLLENAGFKTGEDTKRGFDHGTFVPLKLTWPKADVPVVQLSLKTGLDPAEHLAMGRALAPLRDEGVFIIGSGLSFHNLRAFGPRAATVAQAFDGWLQQTTLSSPAERDRRLTAWESAPGARQCHPREEHLLPLMVIAGAAGDDAGTVAYSDTLMGVAISAHHFG